MGGSKNNPRRDAPHLICIYELACIHFSLSLEDWEPPAEFTLVTREEYKKWLNRMVTRRTIKDHIVIDTRHAAAAAAAASLPLAPLWALPEVKLGGAGANATAAVYVKYEPLPAALASAAEVEAVYC